MSGKPTFHFVTAGIRDALARAREAADGKDIRLGGGVATIREYLRAGLVDEMHLAYAPVLLGSGESLLSLPSVAGPWTAHRSKHVSPDDPIYALYAKERS